MGGHSELSNFVEGGLNRQENRTPRIHPGNHYKNVDEFVFTQRLEHYITLVAAMLALSAKDADHRFILLAYSPVIVLGS